MNIARVYDRFAVLAELNSAELPRWRPLVEDACGWVRAHCRVSEPDDGQEKRLELLAAAYALKLYSACGGSQLSQFVAGDVRLTSSADLAQRAESLWRELTRSNADLIDAGGFIFGRVIV